MTYRAEIDGLRALAVLPVILFHAGVTQLSGGFVGVDVFFVISGFLITGIIARELEQGTFSILRFYERRARRILPALFLVLGVTSIAAVFLMLPYELSTYGQGLAGVVFFVSNIVFWQQSGYFAAASELNPLLHTWSLAVEEQFYIFFPLLLWVIWRWRLRAVWAVLIVIAIASLVMAEFLSTRMSGANFYLLPTRAWELLVGSFAALWLMRNPQPNGFLAEILGIGGLLAIVASIVLFGPATPFPSLYALLPVLGTAAVLLAASPDTLAGRLLGLRPIVGIGLISYSAYLWHQPLFAFARLLTPDNHPPLALMLGLAALALCLAWLSWRFVERPFRQKGGFSQTWIFSASAIGGAVLAGLGVVAIVTNGLPQRYPEAQRAWIQKSPLEYGDYVRGGYRSVNNAPLSQDKPNLVLVGDSFSKDFYNVLVQSAAFQDHNISAIYVPARCQMLYGMPYSEIRDFIKPGDRAMCAKRVLNDAHVAKIQKADIVVFAARWNEWSAPRFAQSLTAMDIPQDTSMLVIGTKKFVSNRRKILELVKAKGTELRVPIDAEVASNNAVLAGSLPKGSFVDVMSLICDQGCPLFTDNGALISYDGLHLTQEGVQFITQRIFDAAPLGDFGG